MHHFLQCYYTLSCVIWSTARSKMLLMTTMLSLQTFDKHSDPSWNWIVRNRMTHFQFAYVHSLINSYSTSAHCVVTENIHTTYTEGIFSNTSATLWKFQLHVSIIHFFNSFRLIHCRTPHPPGNSNPFYGGSMDIFWNCTLNTVVMYMYGMADSQKGAYSCSTTFMIIIISISNKSNDACGLIVLFKEVPKCRKLSYITKLT